MCGIAGWIDWERDLRQEKEILERMGNTLKHRGPDDSGIWVSRNAGMAHTRLIVIDPEGGKQPMIRQYGDHKYIINYNGELYNTNEVREKLEAKGHQFYTHSDTEVLLVSYIEWKEKCVHHLNGIFAFGVWDEKEQLLFLARDRLGVKPLFYTRKNQAFLYGSELKALLAHPLIEAEVDKEGLAEIFGLGPSRTPGHGVFRNISELRPGHYLIHTRSGTHVSPYWKLESKPHEDDLDTTIMKVKELVLDTVDRQLVSDVPVCTFLSGGLDSSIISTVAANVYKKAGKELNTFSVDYVGNKEHFKANEFQPNADEPWVKYMTQQIGSNHHYILVDTPQLAEALEEAVYAKDLPGMADVDSSLYLFSKEIKKKATVGLSGECADEIFGGYPWFFREEDLQSNTFPWIRSIEEREKILSNELKNTLSIKEYVEKRYRSTLEEVPRLAGDSAKQARMREIFYLNMTWFMATLLDRKDRMTMATGLEVRVPFADHRLVEYVWNIPWEMKTIGEREKGILRRAMKGILPDEILERRKSPYPKTHHPEYTRMISEKLMEILNDSSSPLLSLIDLKTVQGLVETGGESFKVPWFGQLMTGPQLLAYLIQVNIWLKKYHVIIR